jgi:protein TonB
VLAIAAAHAGLVVLLLRGGIIRIPAKAEPLTVTMLPQNQASAPLPMLSPPSLVRPQLIMRPPPEINLPTDAPLIANVAQSASTTAAPPTVTLENLALENLAPANLASANVERSTEREPPAMSEIAYLRQPAPHYPPGSRQAREEGLVILQVTIDESGHVTRIAIYRSSGHSRLDEAARDAVAVALFKPYVADGVARAAIAMIPIEFSLRGSSS